MSFVFPPAPQAALAVAGRTDRFPVRRVFCVGRNYAAHAREFGNDPDRDPPFFFTKPADAVVDTPCTVPYPPLTEDLHFEIELVIAIGKGGANIAVADVPNHIWGASVGIDLTRRDLQNEAKKMSRPWDWSKAFDQSAPIAPIVPMADVPSLTQGRIWLAVNGEIKQDADIADLIWPVADHIATLSQAMTLAPGDIVMTGTPAGVGAVTPGDVITGGVDGIGELQVTIGEPA
ncbi:fumarylacetoacetate hydrolase family protein [Pseudosulfitobacter sp. DSM 107133]|jgi:fumarylpyruvate hydrolase|uniref:fumarylacetoacetate hydrolase family protein n=1 Tax=Pseudosulfitobacter sp. DSM 107133 TaxID=2883100 RepID=UPI000DF18354|nr:fumarylacetoacetate hydrolase family protein [Pseudosulfitobacter sp. DSM 107133]UOA25427.1 Fumarylpyruvate hydrolase [Pseudosulfitobacter sp. DSM 107133]